MSSYNDILLVTGGTGFIGSHVAKHLLQDDCRVRIVDINPTSHNEIPSRAELCVGDLRDRAFCDRAVRGVKMVLHFAATMGGMGIIHPQNDFIIYQENHDITLNLLAASINAGVQRFLYASSACVYPDSLQEAGTTNVSLKETDVYAELPPRPQGLYGLEKLHTEHILQQYSSQIEVRIARFHNIYGPGGSWRDGREKVPAALLRKVIAAVFSGSSPIEVEVWGDGLQQRSFCFIDDAVEAIILLLRSDFRQPLNIGSDRAVTINDLVRIAVSSTQHNPTEILYRYVGDKPIGVGSRNSNNDLVRAELGWAPTTSLEDGMRLTGQWISAEMERLLRDLHGDARKEAIRALQTSQVVDLRSDALVFAILLPITSRGSHSHSVCLINLADFARSLVSTTTHHTGRSGRRYRIRIYLAIDADDEFLLNTGGVNKAELVLQSAGLSDVETLVCDYPRGHVCAIWRDCARKAWGDGCDYFTLMGDDVVLRDDNWMSDVCTAFTDLATEAHVPEGFGCVAFTDTSFPGMPTFPVLHRTHMNIFGGDVIPESFINQDGDPFLYQLYRRFGCSRMIASRISNTIGGSTDARRNVDDGVEFDLGFPKTGGGEDIDFCRKKRNFSLSHGGQGFCAAPEVVVTHPWWHDGRRSYWRFYMWSKGDGGLISRYPEFCYRQAAPNGAELLVLCMCVVLVGILACCAGIVGAGFKITSLGMRMIVAAFAANIFHDLYRHFWRNASRLADINMSIGQVQLVLAVMESTLIRIFSEYGRLVGLVERREFGMMGRSFDWFTNRLGVGPRNEENKNRIERVTLFAVILALFTVLSSLNV